jgi:hypothetical protein
VNDSHGIRSLVGQARKKALFDVCAEQFGWTAAAGLAAFILLLLLGTGVVSWRWPAGILLAASAAAAWRIRRRAPQGYEVAQRLDAGLGLKDLLATAYHFEGRETPSRFAGALHSSAEQAVTGVDAGAAIPFRVTRPVQVAAGLAAVALCVMVARYGVLRTMDLRAPLVTMPFDAFAGLPDTPEKRPAAPKTPQLDSLPGFSIPEGDRAEPSADPLAAALKQIEVSGAPMASLDPRQKGLRQDGLSTGPGDGQEESENGGTAGDGQQDTPSGTPDPQRNSGPDTPGKQGDGPRNSLLDKMRDALANMMDRLKMEPKGGTPQTAQSKAGHQQAKNRQQGEKGRQTSGQQQSDPGQMQEGQQPAETDAQNAQQAQGDAPPEPPSNQQRSGIGRQDGSKDTQLAEQLEAMGKLSELLGRRSRDVQGEIMVEVTTSKNPQLRTPYSQRPAQHQDAGGELTRDEVPLHWQRFVQQYYEHLRKQPASQPPQPGAGR